MSGRERLLNSFLREIQLWENPILQHTLCTRIISMCLTFTNTMHYQWTMNILIGVTILKITLFIRMLCWTIGPIHTARDAQIAQGLKWASSSVAIMPLESVLQSATPRVDRTLPLPHTGYTDGKKWIDRNVRQKFHSLHRLTWMRQNPIGLLKGNVPFVE